jgi:hypothetical protein
VTFLVVFERHLTLPQLDPDDRLHGQRESTKRDRCQVTDESRTSKLMSV